MDEGTDNFLDAKRHNVALQLYTNKKASLEYCAEIADMSKEDFIKYLGENQVSIFDFESEERDPYLRTTSGTEWYRKKGEFYQTTTFYTEMQSDMTYDQLRNRINDDVRSFGISACAIVLYEKPIEMTTPFDYFHLPKSAHLFSGFDDKTGFDSKNEKHQIKCNPKEKMLPDGIIQFDSDGVLVFSIYHSIYG